MRDALHNLNWVWDIAHNLNHELLGEFFTLWTAIDEAGLDLGSDEVDEIIWILESSGSYSASSAYRIQFAGQIQSQFPTLIWKAWAPPKCKFFMWLLLQDRLWTAARLQQRQWKNDYFCALCDRNLETAHHLFFECPFVLHIWELVAGWSGCQSLNPSAWGQQYDLIGHFEQLASAGKKVKTVAILTLWNIWRQRNEKVFRGIRRPAAMLMRELKEMATQWSLAGCKVLRRSSVASIISE